jgi:hypothetical protein
MRGRMEKGEKKDPISDKIMKVFRLPSLTLSLTLTLSLFWLTPAPAVDSRTGKG